MASTALASTFSLFSYFSSIIPVTISGGLWTDRCGRRRDEAAQPIRSRGTPIAPWLFPEGLSTPTCLSLPYSRAGRPTSAIEMSLDRKKRIEHVKKMAKGSSDEAENEYSFSTRLVNTVKRFFFKTKSDRFEKCGRISSFSTT